MQSLQIVALCSQKDFQTKLLKCWATFHVNYSLQYRKLVFRSILIHISSNTNRLINWHKSHILSLVWCDIVDFPWIFIFTPSNWACTAVTAVTSKYHYFHLKSLPSYLFSCIFLLQLVTENRFFLLNIVSLKRQLGAESSAFSPFFSLSIPLLQLFVYIIAVRHDCCDMEMTFGRNWCTQAFNIKIRQIVWKYAAKYCSGKNLKRTFLFHLPPILCILGYFIVVAVVF